MASINMERKQQSYLKLSHMFNTFRATLSPHLDGLALAELGVDVSTNDLYDETAHAGLYYIAMSQSRLQTLDQRPNFDPGFFLEADQWNPADGCTLIRAFWEQLSGSRDNSVFSAYEKTKWSLKWKRSSIERTLRENGNGWTSDPTRQYDWELGYSFETNPFPHQTCLSLHHLPNVQGLIRSEMMIITAVMLARYKRQRFQDEEVFPLLMLSVMGRRARIVQAHMCPLEERLKVRYSQLFDFSHPNPRQTDLVVRWLLSDPITETKPPSDGTERPTSPGGDTAPQVVAFNAAESPRTTRCCEDFLQDVASMPYRAMVTAA